MKEKKKLKKPNKLDSTRVVWLTGLSLDRKTAFSHGTTLHQNGREQMDIGKSPPSDRAEYTFHILVNKRQLLGLD